MRQEELKEDPGSRKKLCCKRPDQALAHQISGARARHAGLDVVTAGNTAWVQSSKRSSDSLLVRAGVAKSQNHTVRTFGGTGRLGNLSSD